MFGFISNVVGNFTNVSSRAGRANIRNVGHAAASIRKSVIGSIRKSPFPSKPGTPVHTREGLFKSSLFYSVTGYEAVIGLAYSRVAISGEPHEKGTFYKGHKYPKRSFMRPGLEKIAPRLSGHWAGTIG